MISSFSDGMYFAVLGLQSSMRRNVLKGNTLILNIFFSKLENAKNNAKCKSWEMHSKIPKKCLFL